MISSGIWRNSLNRRLGRILAAHGGSAGEDMRHRAHMKCFAALAMLTAWLVSQTIQFTFIPVYLNMSRAVSLDEGGYIMLAAMWLVLNNSIRAACLYGGWFLLAEGLSEIFQSKRAAWLLPPFAISLSYFGPSLLHFPSIPHFGVPAFIALASVCALLYISRDVTRAGYKFPILAFVVFSIQWLDLIPALTPFGFGWGELSLALKNVAALMAWSYLLDAVCGLAFCSSAMLSLLLARLFVSYEKQIRQLTDLGYDKMPICMAKTQYSLSDDPTKLGAPKDFTVTVRNIKASAGAGFLVALTGDIMTMPGLPKVPAAERIDVDETGKISGLF